MKTIICERFFLHLWLLAAGRCAPFFRGCVVESLLQRDYLVNHGGVCRNHLYLKMISLSASRKSSERQRAAGTTSPANNINNDKVGSPRPRYRHRTIQVRQKPRNRRPKYYWSNVTNVEMELRELWKSVNIIIRDDEPPPIPNEALLNHWKRYDLKAAIVTHGGREYLSLLLGGSRIMPGKWKEAVATSPELQRLLLQPQTKGLSPDLPPLSPQQTKKLQITNTTKSQKQSSSINNKINIDVRKSERWSHKTGRRESGYWKDALVIDELYEYLEQQRVTINRPSVFMPRLSELDHQGRHDLRHAITRFGEGSKQFSQKAGLITFREWNYFEGLYELLLELKLYLDKYHEGNYRVFPIVSQVKSRGHELLHTLIQYYGGRKFVAGKLGMVFSRTGKSYAKRRDGNSATGYFGFTHVTDMDWGDFDLEFGIALLSFIRSHYLAMRPPLQNPVVEMPSREMLLASGGEKGLYLDQQIQKYGGYENVARRLGLELPFQLSR